MTCIFHLIGLRMSTKFLRFCWWIILKDIYHLFLFEIKSNQRVSVNDVSTFFMVPCYIEQPQLCRVGFASSFLFSSFFCVRQVFFQLQPSQGLCLISSSHQLKSAVVLVVLPHSCVVHHPFYGLINNFRVHTKILIKFLSSSYPSSYWSPFSSTCQVFIKFVSSSFPSSSSSSYSNTCQVLIKFFKWIKLTIFIILDNEKNSTCDCHLLSISQAQCTRKNSECSLNLEVFIQILQNFSFINREKMSRCLAWKLKKCILSLST